MTDDLKGGARPFDALNPRGLAAKREYVNDLATKADAQSLALLVECLCDESWYTRDLAEHAFQRLDPPRGDLLLPLLDQGLWYTRTTVARILGRLGHRPAVPALLVLVDDSNATVGAAAREALTEIAARGGTMRLAHALHRAAPDLRQRRLAEIGASDHPLRERLERMMRSEELMTMGDPDGVDDDSPAVRATEEGVEWELLTGPAEPRSKAREAAPPPGDAPAGDGDARAAAPRRAQGADDADG